MIVATFLVILSGLLYFTYWCISYRQKYKSVCKAIPGPKPLPVLGNSLEFGFNCVEKLRNLCRLSLEYGSVYWAWLGPKNLFLVVSDPNLVEQVLSSTKYLKKSCEYDMIKPWLGNGLLVSTGSYWQKRRKLITTTFHFKILEDFVSIFNTNGEVLIKKLYNEIGKDRCDIYPYITAYTLDVICESAMGTTVKAQESPNNEYIKAVKQMAIVFIDRVFTPWEKTDILFRFCSNFRRQKEALNVIHGFANSVIEQRRQMLTSNKNNDKNSNENKFQINKRMAFLDLLLQAEIDGKPLSNEDIREEVDTFMFEGHDTTASSVCFTLYELARNPHVQEKVIKELKDIFGNDKIKQPTLQDLNQMKYLELVIKESLRLYPSVPFYGRELEQDMIYNGIVIPKGIQLIIFAYQMHRDPNIFKNPNKFDPDRFLNENENKNPFSYVPFSGGPRNCIGQKFAMYELKSIVSKTLRHFELLPADSKYDVILSAEMILKSDNGISIRLRER